MPPNAQDPVLLKDKAFYELTLNDATTKVTEAQHDTFEETKIFVEDGDHFNKGIFWVGPPDKDNPAYGKAILKVQKQFVTRDVIEEILDRVVNGVAKQEVRLAADMRVIDENDMDKEFEERVSEADQKRIKGFVRFLTQWFDLPYISFHTKFRLAIKRSRAYGRSYLRLWVPMSQLVDVPPEKEGGKPTGQKQVPPGSFEQTLRRIHLECPKPESCAIIIDEQTQERASVFLFELDKKRYAEIAWVERDDQGEPGDTIVRIVGQDDKKGDTGQVYRWALGGRLPVIEMKAPLLITKAILSQQKRLNFYETNLNRNVETAGFPERYITNAEPSGLLVQRQGEPGPYPTQIINGKVYEVHPVPRVLGAGITTEVQGVKSTNADKSQSISSPEVIRFEPVSPDGTITASRHAYQLMLEQAKQGHILIVGDATASGVSRQQAEGDFISDLSNTRGPAEALVRDTFETLVAMAEFFGGTGEGSYLEDFKVTANLTLTPGTPSPDAQRVAFEIRDKGIISTAEAMTRSGVEDPEAMMDELEQDENYILDRLKKRAETLDALMMSGWTFEAAMLKVGFTQEEVTEARSGTGLPAVQIEQDPSAELALEQQKQQMDLAEKEFQRGATA